MRTKNRTDVGRDRLTFDLLLVREGAAPAKDAFPLLHTAMWPLTGEAARTINPPVTTQQSNWTVNKTERYFSSHVCISSDFLKKMFERNLDCDKKATLEIFKHISYY